MHAATLLDAFSRLDDPRCARGVRHPFAGMVVLMLLGMLARIREMEVLVRWASVHWDQLREPLGFDRERVTRYAAKRMIAVSTMAMCWPTVRRVSVSRTLDIGAIAEISTRLGSYAIAHPEIAEIDINPLVVYPEQEGAVAIDALIVAR